MIILWFIGLYLLILSVRLVAWPVHPLSFSPPPLKKRENNDGEKFSVKPTNIGPYFSFDYTLSSTN